MRHTSGSMPCFRLAAGLAAAVGGSGRARMPGVGFGAAVAGNTLQVGLVLLPCASCVCSCLSLLLSCFAQEL